MTGDGTITAAAATAPHGRPTGEGWDRVRFGLLAVALGLTVCAGLSGARAGTLTDLKAAIVAGDVHEVRIDGALPPGATGSAVVHLFWQDGVFTRFARILQQSDDAVTASAQFPELQHVVGDVVGDLRRLDGSGTLRIRPDEAVTSTGPTVAGWLLPVWADPVLAFVWLAVIVLLVHGPQPLWATRWAWFWPLFSPLAPVAILGFLLLSGPPPGVPRSEQPGRRLTGGWSFLLVSALVPAWRSLVP